MKVSEIMNNEDPVKRLLGFVDGHTYGTQIEQIKQHLVKEGTEGDAGEREAPSRPPPFAPNGADERARASDHSSGKERRVR